MNLYIIDSILNSEIYW